MISVAKIAAVATPLRVAMSLAAAALMFGSAAAYASAGGAAPGSQGDGTVTVHSMGFVGDGGPVRIRFEASGPVDPKLTVLENPSKVVVRLERARFENIAPLTVVGDGTVESVEVAALPDGAGEIRVSPLAAAKAEVALRQGGFDLIVTPLAPAAVPAAAPVPASAAAKSRPAEIQVGADRILFRMAQAPGKINGFVLSDGVRLVIDMQGISWAGEAMVEEYAEGPVARLIIRPTAESVRAVLEARTKGAFKDFRIEPAQTGFDLCLAGGGDASLAVAQAPVSSEAPAVVLATDVSAAGAMVVDFGFHQDADRSYVDLSLSGPAAHEVTEASGTRVVLDLRNTRLPAKYQRALDTSAFPGYVRLVAAYGRGKDTRVVVDLLQATPFKVETRPDGLSIAFEGGAKAVATGPAAPEVKDRIVLMQPEGEAIPQDMAAPAPSEEKSGVSIEGMPAPAAPGSGGDAFAPTKTGHRGRRVSMDFVDADIRNVMRLLGEVGGINIVAGSEVSGKITVRLVDVPWDQALEVILKAKGYDKEFEGNIMRVVSAERLAQERAAKMAAEQAAIRAKEELTPLANDIFPVSYAKASEIVDKIKSLLSPRGSVSVDDRTNTILIRDLPENIDAARQLVVRLDTATPQVLIEARIVEISSTYTEDLGVQWGGSFTMDDVRGNATDYAFPHTVGVKGDSGLSNYAVNFPAAAAAAGSPGGALALSLGHINDVLSLDLRLSAIETSGKGRVVSSPRVATLDNKPAEISQGIEIPFTTATEEKIETKSIDYLLKLIVTPHVTSDDSIVLKIELNKDSPSTTFFAADSSTPAKETRKATTEVLVRDGETTVIGGIITDSSSDRNSGIPWFRKIPLIGWMFESNFNRTEKTELIIFITPKIVRIEDTARL